MVYKWYILPIGGLHGTYHPLREPETTIDPLVVPVICRLFFLVEVKERRVKMMITDPARTSILNNLGDLLT